MIEGRDRDQSVSGLATRAARTQRWRVFGRAAKRVLPRASQGAIIPVESSSSSRQIQHRNPPVVELVSPVSSGIESAVKRERSAIARSREGALGVQPSSARPTFRRLVLDQVNPAFFCVWGLLTICDHFPRPGRTGSRGLDQLRPILHHPGVKSPLKSPEYHVRIAPHRKQTPSAVLLRECT